MKKSHVIGAVIFSLFFLWLAFLPKILKAGSGDHASYDEAGVDVMRIKAGGAIETSSGISSNKKLWGGYYYFANVPSAATDSVRAQQNFSTDTALNLSTTLVIADLIQPAYPRILRLQIMIGSGTAIFKGTDTLGNVVEDTISFASGTAQNYTQNCFAFLSSVTIRITSVSVQVSSFSYGIGVSSYVGLPNRLHFSTDIFRITEAEVYRSTLPALSTAPYHSVFLPGANGTNDYGIWHHIRETLTAPSVVIP